MLLIEVNTQF